MPNKDKPFDLQEFTEKLLPTNRKNYTSKLRIQASITRFICHTGVRARELITIRKQDCEVLTDKTTGEQTVAIRVKSIRNKRYRTVYCPFHLFVFIKATSGHPTLLFSRRSRKSKLGYVPLCVRRIQNVIFNTSRRFGTPLTIEKIRGEGIASMLQNTEYDNPTIMKYYDVGEHMMNRITYQVFVQAEENGVVA
jgi:integrase